MEEKDNITIEEDENSESKIKKIKEQLKTCQKEKEEYLDGWQRAKADFVNARREEEKKREEFVRFSNQVLILDILPVLDSFDLAAENIKDKGFYLVRNQIGDILKRYGLEVIKTKEEKFNPEVHEAIQEVESEKESGTIIEEIQRGYKLHNRVLRPAKVKVSR